MLCHNSILVRTTVGYITLEHMTLLQHDYHRFGSVAHARQVHSHGMKEKACGHSPFQHNKSGGSERPQDEETVGCLFDLEKFCIQRNTSAEGNLADPLRLLVSSSLFQPPIPTKAISERAESSIDHSYD